MKYKNASGYLAFPVILLLVLGCGMFRDGIPPKTFDPQNFNPYLGKLETLPEKLMGTYYGEKYSLKKLTPIQVSGASEAVKAEYEISASWGSSYSPRKMTVEIINYPTAEQADQQIRAVAQALSLSTQPYILKNQEIGKIAIDGKKTSFYWTNGSLFCKSQDETFHHLAKF